MVVELIASLTEIGETASSVKELAVDNVQDMSDINVSELKEDFNKITSVDKIESIPDSEIKVSDLKEDFNKLYSYENSELNQESSLTISDLKEDFKNINESNDNETPLAAKNINTDNINTKEISSDLKNMGESTESIPEEKKLEQINKESSNDSINQTPSPENINSEEIEQSENKETRALTDDEKQDSLSNIERKQETAKEIREDGKRREDEARNELNEKYPEENDCKIIEQAYFRDVDGNVVKDEKTGEARRADFVVVKDGEIVEVIEVTSETANKDSQMAKEERIRDQGGNYIKDPDTGELIKIPDDVKTTIDRRE